MNLLELIPGKLYKATSLSYSIFPDKIIMFLGYERSERRTLVTCKFLEADKIRVVSYSMSAWEEDMFALLSDSNC